MIETKHLKAYNSPAMKWLKSNRHLTQRFIALLACTSILVSALAPAVSQAMVLVSQPQNESGQVVSQSTPSGMMKVCTSTGNKFIPVSFILAKANISATESIPNSTSRSSKSDSMTACSYCDQHTGTHAVFAYATNAISLEKISQQYAATLYLNPRSYLFNSPSSPRGPPSQLI